MTTNSTTTGGAGEADSAESAGLTGLLAGARRRLSLPGPQDRAFWTSRDPVSVEAVMAQATDARGRPWPQPLASAYARYWRDGNRTAFEEPTGALRSRTAGAVIAALLTGQQDWVDEAVDGLVLVCEQSTWCWAAHESFASARGDVVPDVTEPYLDLGAGEMAGLLAWADHALGQVLDARAPGLRRRLRHEVRRRVIDPFLSRQDWHWLGLDGHVHNWNPWIHGNVVAAALFLVDDPADAAEVVDRCLAGLARYARSLPRDGGCDEGAGYWWQGAARFAEAMMLLQDATAGRAGGLSDPVLDEVARFPRRMDLGDGWRVSFADCTARQSDSLPWNVLFQWGLRSGLDDVVAHARAQRDATSPVADPDAGLGRALRALVDDGWRDVRPEPVELDHEVWLPDLQVLVAREDRAPARGLVVAAKGGHNDENHNHNDIGAYLVAVDGVPVVVDLGQQTYTAISFSDRRYEQLTVQAPWHDVPVVNGVAQVAGRQFHASGAVHGPAPGPAGPTSLTLDLTAAYPPAAACRSWTRGVTLERGTPFVQVTDTYVSTPDAVTGPAIPHVIAGTVNDHGAGSLTVTSLGGRTVLLSWDPDLGPGRLERHTLDDPMLVSQWGPVIHRLWLDLTDPRQGRLSLTVRPLPKDHDGHA